LQPDIVSASFWGHLQQNPFTKNNTTQTYLLTDKDLDFIQQTLIIMATFRLILWECPHTFSSFFRWHFELLGEIG